MVVEVHHRLHVLDMCSNVKKKQQQQPKNKQPIIDPPVMLVMKSLWQ